MKRLKLEASNEKHTEYDLLYNKVGKVEWLHNFVTWAEYYFGGDNYYDIVTGVHYNDQRPYKIWTYLPGKQIPKNKFYLYRHEDTNDFVVRLFKTQDMFFYRDLKNT